MCREGQASQTCRRPSDFEVSRRTNLFSLEGTVEVVCKHAKSSVQSGYNDKVMCPGGVKSPTSFHTADSSCLMKWFPRSRMTSCPLSTLHVKHKFTMGGGVIDLFCLMTDNVACLCSTESGSLHCISGYF